MNQDELKQQVGREAVKYIRPGMVVGLGTGTTVHCLVEALGEHVKNGDLSDIVCVTTSNRTTRQAQSLGIKVEEIDDVDHIDLTIDGADEISDNFQGIKGGGGALLWEKIVSNYSDHVMWIVDESKLVHHLGAFPLPVEVTHTEVSTSLLSWLDVVTTQHGECFLITVTSSGHTNETSLLISTWKTLMTHSLFMKN